MIHETNSWLNYGLVALLGAFIAITGLGVLLILRGTVWRGLGAA